MPCRGEIILENAVAHLYNLLIILHLPLNCIMKKDILLIFCLVLSTISMAQEQAIKITSEKAAKEIVIKENKRIKVQTSDGQKIAGRFKVVDDNSIMVNDKIIALSDILSVKRNPLLLSIFTSSFLIYAGAITVGIGAIVGVFADSSGFLVMIPGAAMIYTGIKSPNFLKNYKTDSDWTFELISISE